MIISEVNIWRNLCIYDKTERNLLNNNVMNNKSMYILENLENYCVVVWKVQRFALIVEFNQIWGSRFETESYIFSDYKKSKPKPDRV